MFDRPFIACLFIYVIAIIPCTTAYAQDDQPLRPATNLVLLDMAKGFQVVSISASDAKNQKFGTRSVRPTPGVYGEAVGVFGGHMLSLFSRSSWSPALSDKLLATDLRDGTVRVVASKNVVKANCIAGQLYLISKLEKKAKEHTHKLTHIDLSSFESTDICHLRCEREMMGAPDFALEVSPDGRTVAVSDMRKTIDFADAKISRVIFAKAGSSDIVKTSYAFRSITQITGAGDFLKAPEFSWLDNERLLFAGYSTDGSEFKLGRGARIMPMGGEAMKVSLINAKDGSISKLCDLPKASYPSFVPTPGSRENHAMLHLRRLGLHELDVKHGTVKEAATIEAFESADAKKDSKHLPLTCEQVSKIHEYGRLIPEPGGTRLAWSGIDSGAAGFGFGGSRPDAELFVFDSDLGNRLVYKGRIAASMETAISPPKLFVVWASNAEMKPSKKFLDLALLTIPKPKVSRKDSRPDIKACLEVDIQTDKESYFRNEPVKLTITVRNTTDTNYRFEKRQIMNGGQPFGLDNKFKHKGGRNEVHLFDPDENDFEGDFLEFPAGDTVVINRTAEVEEVGEQRFELDVTHWGTWKGTILVKAHFEVLAETTNELLRQKFDRTLTICQKRWKRTEGRAGLMSSKFWQLGDEGGELLVDFLDNCEDDLLKDQLTRGISHALSDPVLNYLERRLTTDMEHDRKSVVQCLSSLVTRAKYKRNKEMYEKARNLLLAAGQHPDSTVKLMAIGSISKSLPEDADQVMLKAVEDPNDAIARFAAKYIAIRQQLPLKKWLEYARNHPSRATKLAAITFGKKIAGQWDHELNSAEIESGLTTHFEQTIGKLIEWCERHPRNADKFMEQYSLQPRNGIPRSREKRKPIVLLQQG